MSLGKVFSWARYESKFDWIFRFCIEIRARFFVGTNLSSYLENHNTDISISGRSRVRLTERNTNWFTHCNAFSHTIHRPHNRRFTFSSECVNLCSSLVSLPFSLPFSFCVSNFLSLWPDHLSLSWSSDSALRLASLNPHRQKGSCQPLSTSRPHACKTLYNITTFNCRKCIFQPTLTHPACHLTTELHITVTCREIVADIKRKSIYLQHWNSDLYSVRHFRLIASFSLPHCL